MLHSFLLVWILILSLAYSWYSFYGIRYLKKPKLPNQTNEEKKVRVKPKYVPAYMWDIYNNGMNSSDFDIVKGIYPLYTGTSFNSRFYRSYKKKILDFNVPEFKKDEVLVKAEIKITVSMLKNETTHFQIYLKSEKWIFLDEKKVSNVNETWLSLQVTSKNQDLKPGPVRFLILTVCLNLKEKWCRTDFSHPVLLLSYFFKGENSFNRKKRHLEMEDFEEKTNKIWRVKFFPQDTGKENICRRKSLYIKFSEIDYDSWIVAPSGYEAFQCVGKCTFPISEHLSPTTHAILQTLLHDISPWKASTACCVPVKLDPISILYIDENGVLTYRFKYRDMVVAECGCR